MVTAPTSSRELYLRLLGYVRPYWRAFALAVLGMVLTAATEPLFPALMKPLLDGSFVKRDTSHLHLIPLALIGIFLLRGVLTYVASYSLAWVSNKVMVDVRNAMFARLVSLPTRYYDAQSSGALISKIAYDVQGLAGAATSVLTVLVRDSLTVVGLLAWLLYLNWKLTLVTLVIVPGIAIAVRLFSRRLRNLSLQSMRTMGEITHVIEESIACHKVMKIFGGRDYEADRFNKANETLRGYSMRQAIAAAATVPIVQTFAAIALAIIISIAVVQSASEEFTVGGFVSFITAMLMLLAPLRHLADVNAPLQRGLASAQSVFQLLDEVPEEDRGTLQLGRVKGRIEFDKVSLLYPGSERPALEEVSLQIEPGQTVALVGRSGGGKTSLVNLLPRFYQANGGRILFDGIDIREVRLESLRANIALVSQDVSLFNDTVAANIAYGTMKTTSAEAIEQAAHAAHALEFIREMPQGFNTQIGEKGVRLSGGQRQRLAIARALLKDAPVLLLDEATSALDSESERHVQAALATLMRGRTTIVIAHRLSTIEYADRIVVLQRGRVAETGTHAELLVRNGLYARLHRIQFAFEEDPADEPVGKPSDEPARA